MRQADAPFSRSDLFLRYSLVDEHLVLSRETRCEEGARTIPATQRTDACSGAKKERVGVEAAQTPCVGLVGCSAHEETTTDVRAGC